MKRDATIKAIKEELKFKDFELNSLLEITKGINSNQSLDYLLSVYEYILKEQLGLQKFVLYKKQKTWTQLIKTGIRGHINELNIEEDLLRFKKITLIESSSNKGLNQFDVVIPVYHQNRALAFLLLTEDARGNNELNFSSSIKELSFIETLTNIIVVAIENKRMTQLGLKQERIKKELEVASEMQKLLFPDDLPSDKRFDLAATYTARHEVGGDYYDFIRINDDEFFVCIADVSGKGVGAAMLMANFQATIRTLLSFEKYDLDYLIHELNRKVIHAAKGEKFITFFIGKYNSKTRKFHYVNAGHNHPILTTGKKAQFLDRGSIGLGMLDEIPFIESDEIEIQPNSTLILYTDGIVELQNSAGDYFETDRLIKLIHSFYPLKMEDLNNLIFSKLDEFKEKEDLVDDTAIFSCRFF
ncbi:PP2C family protein-serine/threonine phosphatase [Brumimicrobium aurantiacum]|uniref:Serine/threonine protein phosphatase n=1 Tax=Brumimicrobium aurantiacum TaxID=1737063 RepID=A0A3E1EXV9_9FLAO|nr:PP2C family protein-serine/threonine phosphatase [Brumimicrobium aurantiacum]RFC54391.1 serine/threonine protein phosphatase [Brumimicrobium aurantiacum]